MADRPGTTLVTQSEPETVRAPEASVNSFVCFAVPDTVLHREREIDLRQGAAGARKSGEPRQAQSKRGSRISVLSHPAFDL
jgi:hypothetical protein